MPIITENSEVLPHSDNIRRLVYFFDLLLEERLTELRKGTPYADSRPSDIRVFVAAARGAKSISTIARELQISRQAAQTSVQRLQERGVVESAPQQNNLRDRMVTVTALGREAGLVAVNQITQVERELADTIGQEAWLNFRENLKKMIAALNANKSKKT